MKREFVEVKTENIKLIETKNCPVCGGKDREKANGMSPKTGYHYLKHAASSLQISFENLIESMQVNKCKDCGSYFCDPWFSPELASALFCASAPDHIAGWGSFEHWLHPRRSLNRDQARNQRLYSIVTERIGPISSYAEFGCPFQGFLLQLKEEETNASERVNLFSRALYREPDVRWTMITRIYHNAQRLCNILVVLYLRIRLVLAALPRPTKAKGRQGNEGILVPSPPRLRYLLTEDTTKGWGSNCVRYGASCRYFANMTLGASVIPLNEIQPNGFPRFDLIGIFNSLDHTTYPLDVIRKSLEHSERVLVVTHKASQAGKQHLYAFGDDFTNWLNKTLKGITAEDLQNDLDEELHRDYSCILLSKKASTT